MRERIYVHAFCLLIAVAAFIGAAWTVLSGQVELQGLDALFLLFVCLLAAAVFAAIPIAAIRKGRLKK